MRKTFFTACLLIATSMQAQVLYVNNNDGTYQAIDTEKAGDITFDEEQRLIDIQLTNDKESTIASRFCTDGIKNIAPSSNQGRELTYNLKPTVAFDTTEKENFNEITEEIPTDELDDEYSDFVENFNFSTGRIITITFSEVGVTTSSLPNDITATINGGHIVINSVRSNVGYKLKGTCSNGSLKIYSTKKFQITAVGVNLTNPTGPAINIQSGKTVYFTLQKGTTNTLCDGATYNSPVIATDGSEEDQKGTLFSEGQLIFNGTGTLNVKSLGGHAICSDDYIRVRGGNINILEAAKDGFRTKDKFIIGRTKTISPVITINATGNGIDLTEGTLTIEAGKIDIKSGGEGIKVEYEEPVPDPAVIPDAYIKGGFIKIATTDDKSSAIKVTRNYTQSGGIIQAETKGNGSKIINCDGAIAFSGGKVTGVASGTVTADETAAGGIKCNGNLNISGGEIAIECNGKGSKGINCNAEVTIDGGETTLIATGDNYTEIADDKKSRGITAGNITMSGGKVVVSAHDNALNAITAITIAGGTLNAYSATGYALNLDAIQTGGWLLYKENQE
ncbi:MAG: carbohydrate-binding domain-containing protein [Bacteroidaceae bacterium]|nr:carbohydrate-binding domain-containing protein [Bacteroidaceae bacterium]